MADNSQATAEMGTAGVVDTNPSDVPDTTSDGSTVTQDDGKKPNGEAIVFGTVQPDTRATEESDPPAKEESDPPAQEKSTPPPEEESAPPAQEEPAPPLQEKSASPPEEESAPPAKEKSVPPAQEEPAPPVQEKSALSEQESAPPVQEKSAPPAQEEPARPAEEESAPLAEDEAAPPAEEEPAPPIAVEEPAPRAGEDSDSAPSGTCTTTELGRVANRIVPHLLNLYNSMSTAHDFDAIYAPNATFEDPLMRAQGVAQIKSAFYALTKVFLDSTVVQYAVVEEETSSGSGEIYIDNLQQYKLLQLGPVGYYATLDSLIKLTVEKGKVVRHEDLWGGYRLWNRHTVRVPLVGRLAETMRWGNMLVTHMLMGFGKDHKTLDKDSSFQLKVPSNEKKNL